MTKPDPKEEKRAGGPKFRKNVLPTGFQIRRPASPMADILNEAERESEPNPSNQLNLSSQPNMSSQLTEQPGGGSVSKQPNMSSQLTPSSQPNLNNQVLNILASIPDIKGYLRLVHKYSDYLCRLLKPDEQAVYIQLFRLSWGNNKETCFISNPRLAERSNVPLSSMKRAVSGLIQKGVIEKTGQSNGYGKEQGVEYRVFSLDSQPNMSSQPNMGTIKEKLLKEKLKREEAPPDYKTCPDCNGSGFWYPEGVEKGVAKCKHERMESK